MLTEVTSVQVIFCSVWNNGRLAATHYSRSIFYAIYVDGGIRTFNALPSLLCTRMCEAGSCFTRGSSIKMDLIYGI